MDTKPPTKDQLIRLYDVENDGDLIVDDSAVNYEEVGEYFIVFSQEQGMAKTVKMVVQNHSPIELIENPLIQLKYGANESLTLANIQQLLGIEVANGLKLKILEGQVNQKDIGRYPLMLEMTDSYGRKIEQQIMVDVLDLQAPTIQIAKRSIHYPLGERMTKEQIMRDAEMTITDDYSDAKNISVTWILDAVLENKVGNYRVGVQAKDENNNQSATEYVMIKIGDKYDYKDFLQYEVFEKPGAEKMAKDIGASNIESIAMDKVDFTRPATYQMPVQFTDGVRASIKVSIVDTTAPVMTVNAKTLEYQNAEYLTEQRILEDLEVYVEDNYTKQPEIEFSKTMEQLQAVGQHQLILTARDSSGNKTQKIIQLNIIGENAVLGSVGNVNDETMDELTWEVGEVDKVEEEETAFQEKILSPTLEAVNDQIQLLQPDEKIAANIVPLTNQQKVNRIWPYFGLFVLALILLSILVLNPMKKRKKRKVAVVSNRRYRKNQ
ncbi:MAG: LapB repeat-containing protein [Kurthia sp.]|nr:LapB repeat-containing protein [Candidatus Kurthia equi]